MKKSVTLEHVDPMLEEVGHLHGPFGDRSVTSTEKQMVLPGHVPSVHFGAECSAASLPHFLFFLQTLYYIQGQTLGTWKKLSYE